MDIRNLPRWATPFENESAGSWLEATRRCLSIEEPEWQAWIDADTMEPDQPAVGVVWAGMPEQLGSITQIPPIWRLAPEHRHVFCEECHVDQVSGRRWPTCTQWLDARTLTCARHERCLVYRKPGTGQPLAVDARQLSPEFGALIAWLDQWRAMDECDSPNAAQESAWRKDLVELSMRNWTHLSDYGEYATPGWELHAAGWDLPGRILPSPPDLPVRVGELSPIGRIGALLASCRWWLFFQAETHSFDPHIAQAGLAWLSQHWRGRLSDIRRKRLTALRKALARQSASTEAKRRKVAHTPR